MVCMCIITHTPLSPGQMQEQDSSLMEGVHFQLSWILSKVPGSELAFFPDPLQHLECLPS